jgi:hypothetical protein
MHVDGILLDGDQGGIFAPCFGPYLVTVDQTPSNKRSQFVQSYAVLRHTEDGVQTGQIGAMQTTAKPGVFATLPHAAPGHRPESVLVLLQLQHPGGIPE